MTRILILFHKHQRHRPQLLIHSLAAEWRRKGLNISTAYGTDTPIEADLVFPQIDLTRTPDEYVKYCDAFPKVVNRFVTDISKRRVSSNLLKADDDYRGPVIVKTDNNAAGVPEYSMSGMIARYFWRVAHKALPVAEHLMGRQMEWRKTLIPYRIYNSVSEVPEGVFANPRMIVERFLPEKDDNLYYMRHYLCLGDRVRSVRVSGASPFLKRTACAPVDEGIVPPDEVLDLRRSIGLDYGKIDYTMHEGRAVILDVNRTPGPPGSEPATARTVRDLAEGVFSLL